MKNNRYLSFIKLLIFLLIVCTIFIIFLIYQEVNVRWEIKRGIERNEKINAIYSLKGTIPLIKQWIEAKENWCKSNKEKCKIMKNNNGFCYDCFNDASDFGMSWPEDYDYVYRVSFTSWGKKTCDKELLCHTKYFVCSAMHSTVYCGTHGITIMGALKDVSNYPLGNQLSCVAFADDEDGNIFCKQISGKDPISLNYNFEMEDELASFSDYCKTSDPKTCEDIRREHPLNEFNYYPLEDSSIYTSNFPGLKVTNKLPWSVIFQRPK